MEKIRTTVRIAGKDYAMTSYDSEAHVQRVAHYVDRKMTELALAMRIPPQQLAVLTALNVTDDMLKAHDEINRLRREIGELRTENAALREKLENRSEG